MCPSDGHNYRTCRVGRVVCFCVCVVFARQLLHHKRRLEGHQSEFSPTPADSRNLLEDRTPTLIIMEHLMRAGWGRGFAPRLHLEDTPKLFGQDHFSRKKHYLQCLVAGPGLRERGLLALPSRQSSWYYRAVLAAEDPASVEQGLSVKEYKALLCSDGQAPPPAALEDDAGIQALEDAGVSDDESDAELVIRTPGRGRDSVPQPEVRLPLPPSAAGPQSVGQSVPAIVEVMARPVGSQGRARSLSSSSSSSSAASMGIPGQAVETRQPVHDCIKVEQHLLPGQDGYYRRYTTQCPLARTEHCSVVACGKRRNCGQAQMGRLGPAAPEAFLMVWRNAARSFATKLDHQRWSPSEAEVRRYMVEQGWPLGQV